MYSFRNSTSERLSRYNERALKCCVIKSYLAVFNLGVGSGIRYVSQQYFIAPVSTFLRRDLS